MKSNEPYLPNIIKSKTTLLIAFRNIQIELELNSSKLKKPKLLKYDLTLIHENNLVLLFFFIERNIDFLQIFVLEHQILNSDPIILIIQIDITFDTLNIHKTLQNMIQ